MVHFGHYLVEHAVPEWSEKYLNYKRLKKMLKPLASRKPEKSSTRLKKAHPSWWELDHKNSADDLTDGMPKALSSLFSQEEATQDAPKAEIKSETGMRMEALPYLTAHAEKPIEKWENLVPTDIPARVVEVEFAQALQQELKKIDEFYIKQEMYFFDKANILGKQLRKFQEILKAVGPGMLGKLKKNMPQKGNARNGTAEKGPQYEVAYNSKHGALPGLAERKKRQEVLDIACKELYRGLDLLKNYRILNYTGFHKVLKKHDKLSEFCAKPIFLHEVRKARVFWSETPMRIEKKLEEIYNATFNLGGKQKKHELIDSLHGNYGRQLSAWTTCGLGLCLGVSLCLILTFIVIVEVTPNFSKQIYFISAFPVFRGIGLLLFQLWLWGVNVYFYQLTRINHVFILKIRRRSFLRFQDVWQGAGVLSVIYMGCLVLYFLGHTITKHGASWLGQPGWVVMALFLLTVAMVACPFNVLQRSARLALGEALARIIMAPFRKVKFIDFFFADQLTSSVRVLSDVQYAFCYIGTASFLANDAMRCQSSTSLGRWVLSFLPSYWRLMQCLRRYRDSNWVQWNPHLLNAGKYFSACIVTLFSLLTAAFPKSRTLLVLWIICAVISTVLSYSWDIIKDWSLFEKWKPLTLRRKRVVKQKWVYYAAAFFNLVLRVVWVMTISPTQFGLEIPQQFQGLALAAAELTRRCVWNFFRMENEHLNNCGQFRAVEVIPLPNPTSMDFPSEKENKQKENEKRGMSWLKSLRKRGEKQEVEKEDSHSKDTSTKKKNKNKEHESLNLHGIQIRDMDKGKNSDNDYDKIPEKVPDDIPIVITQSEYNVLEETVQQPSATDTDTNTNTNNFSNDNKNNTLERDSRETLQLPPIIPSRSKGSASRGEKKEEEEMHDENVVDKVDEGLAIDLIEMGIDPEHYRTHRGQSRRKPQIQHLSHRTNRESTSNDHDDAGYHGETHDMFGEEPGSARLGLGVALRRMFESPSVTSRPVTTVNLPPQIQLTTAVANDEEILQGQFSQDQPKEDPREDKDD